MIRRKQKSRGGSSHQAMSNSFSSNSTSSSTNTPSASPSTTLNASMILRRHNAHQNLNQTINLFITNNNNNNDENKASNNFASLTSPSTNNLLSNNNTNTTAMSPSNFENNQLLSKLMKSSCPGYFQIPRTTRKRILRFLCDNGWIDVSS